MPNPADGPQRGPNCWQCRFFAVSWDPRLPYACHRLGFKSAALPALEVLVLTLGWIAIWAVLSRFHPERQFWHDALAGTRLISVQREGKKA